MPDRIDPAAVLGIDPTGRYNEATAATDRSFAAYLTATERDQLDARAATAEQERGDARDDRDAYKEARDVLRKQLDQAIAERDAARQLNNQLAETIGRKQDTINAWAAELGAAGDVLAVVRDAAERIDRALGTYDTQQQQHVSVLGWCITCGSKCPNGRCPNDASPRLGSPSPRAQDEPGRRSETGCMGDPDTELRLAGVHPDQEAARRQSDARRLLDHAILAALPLAGGRVRKLLKALRHELVRVDAKRAEKAEG